MNELEDMQASVSRTRSKVDRWSSVATLRPEAENADTPAAAVQKWSSIYKLFNAATEKEQDEVFAAVNLYFLRNGASPRGAYKRNIKTAGLAVAVSAGEVVKITGKLEGEIRQFLRGRLEDSYLFLKNNKAVREDEQFAAIAENAGVPRSDCWLLADWLGRDCQYFVGNESEIYNSLRSSKIALANAKARSALPQRDAVALAAPEGKMNIGAIQPRVQSARFNDDLM